MANITEETKLEKFYTPERLLNRLYEMAKDIPNTEEYLENSAGSGSIIDQVIKKLNKPYIAYDILNETLREDIIEVNYLKEKIEYKPNRVAIINPPFSKGLKFVYKALEECDWVICILAVSSIISLDYTKYYVNPDEIEIWKKQKFGDIRIDISLMKIRKRNSTDKYEYEI